MPRASLLAVSLALCASAAWSQTTTDAGSSVIRGRVIATATGRAIRGATVNVSAPELRQARTATTDADGRYELKELPSGRYTVSARRQTFITLQRGQTRPFEAAKPLVLGDKETINNVDFSLPRGGVITGRVVDELGDPVVNVTVRAMRMRYVPGGRDDLGPVGTAVPTNDLGVFRIFGLSPGQYYVFASLRYALASDPAGSAFAASYFPGVTALAQAQRVTVALGQTAAISDLTLTPVKTATITGRVIDADGRPISAGGLNLLQRAPAPTEGIGFTQLRPDGTFRVSNVPAGDYDLSFDVNDVNFATARPGQAPRAVAHLVLDGSDLSDLVVSLTRMSGGIGRLILPAGAPPLNPSAVRLGTFPTNPYENRWYGGEATVKGDLSFDFTSPAGQMTVRVTTPRGWALKEVRHGEKVVTDTGLTFVPGEKAKDIEIELTNQPPIISGTVRAAKGEPADDYAVVLFAQDAELRRSSARFFAVARPDQSGQFRLDTLPPGEYFAVALDYVDPSEAGNPDLLRRLESGATRFSVREGETQSLALRITVP